MAAKSNFAGGRFVTPEDPAKKLLSTVVICFGCLMTGLSLPTTGPEIDIYRFGAYVMGIMLAAAFAIEGTGGVRSLNRIDIVAIFGLYFLTFAEFLHPHVKILYQGFTGNAAFSCRIVLVGMAFLTIGRHFPLPLTLGIGKSQLPELPPRQIFWLFIGLFALTFFWVFLSVKFNPIEVFHYMMAGRFERPWQRGRVGGWTSFLTEMQLLAYPSAALAGYLFANAKRFGKWDILIVAALVGFTLLFFISDGSRNRVLIYAGILVSSYFVANVEVKSLKLIAVAGVALAVLWFLSGFMLDFRNVGLGEYFTGRSASLVVADASGDFMLDNNLVSIARVAQVFPDVYPFPGWDVVAQIFTKWIPRALWPDKPIDWANSMEMALNTGGAYTIAVTYVGEAYLIAGLPTVILCSLFLGSLGATWTKVGLAARTNLDLVYYATGFFAAMLGMRSIQFITIAFVPLVGFYLLARWLGRNTPQLARRTS